MTTATITNQEINIARIFDAPRELVFKAWTDPEMLLRWYAPRGCSVRFAKLDVRTGGSYLSCITTPDGHECWCGGTYEEIVEPERIQQTMFNTDADGNCVDPAAIGMDPEWPRQMVLTVTFEEVGTQTQMTLHQTVSEALARKTGAYPSWLNMFDRLDEELARSA